MKIYEGNLIGHGLKIAVVVARFNEFITSKLLDGALDTLKRHETPEELAAKKLAESKNFDAVICLGAVIRGATTHYDYVCNEVSKGIAQISLETGVPTIFGIVTTENLQQAVERAGTKSGNKGADAAISALEMVNLLKSLGIKRKWERKNTTKRATKAEKAAKSEKATKSEE